MTHQGQPQGNPFVVFKSIAGAMIASMLALAAIPYFLGLEGQEPQSVGKTLLFLAGGVLVASAVVSQFLWNSTCSKAREQRWSRPQAIGPMLITIIIPAAIRESAVIFGFVAVFTGGMNPVCNLGIAGLAVVLARIDWPNEHRLSQLVFSDESSEPKDVPPTESS